LTWADTEGMARGTDTPSDWTEWDQEASIWW
jgi:hypothetical protein